MKSKVVKYLQLILGSAIFAASVNFFLEPCLLNSGGVIGTAQIINYLLPGYFQLTGVINLCLNIPLFLIALKNLSWEFCFKTLLSIGIQTVLFTWLPVPAPILPDVLSNAIIGAFVAGIGIGLCLRGQGCAGGLDILGMVLAKKKPDFSVGKLSYIVNAFVLAISAFLFDLQVSLYSFVFIIITYYVSDKVHIQNINVWALIITRNPEVKSIIMSKTGRGVTFWNGYGAYTDRPEEILVTAINKYEVRTLKNLVKEADPEAFVILTEGDPIRGNFEKRLIS